jgi:hypothetical protein
LKSEVADFGFAMPENIAKNTDFRPQARNNATWQRLEIFFGCLPMTQKLRPIMK